MDDIKKSKKDIEKVKEYTSVDQKIGELFKLTSKLSDDEMLDHVKSLGLDDAIAKATLKTAEYFAKSTYPSDQMKKAAAATLIKRESVTEALMRAAAIVDIEKEMRRIAYNPSDVLRSSANLLDAARQAGLGINRSHLEPVGEFKPTPRLTVKPKIEKRNFAQEQIDSIYKMFDEAKSKVKDNQSIILTVSVGSHNITVLALKAEDDHFINVVGYDGDKDITARIPYGQIEVVLVLVTTPEIMKFEKDDTVH